jgi:hypothetical protein
MYHLLRERLVCKQAAKEAQPSIRQGSHCHLLLHQHLVRLQQQQQQVQHLTAEAVEV